MVSIVVQIGGLLKYDVDPRVAFILISATIGVLIMMIAKEDAAAKEAGTHPSQPQVVDFLSHPAVLEIIQKLTAPSDPLTRMFPGGANVAFNGAVQPIRATDNEGIKAELRQHDEDMVNFVEAAKKAGVKVPETVAEAVSFLKQHLEANPTEPPVAS